MFDGAMPDVLAFWVSPEVWPAFAERVQQHIEQMAAGSGDRYRPEDIAAYIANGRMQLWLALEGASILCAMVTEVHDYPRLRALCCVGVVGHRPRRWMHLMENIKAVARQNLGCHRMEALHDPAHARLLGPEWRQWHVLSECDL